MIKHFQFSQSGATLAVSLLMLLVITVIGVSSIQVANLEEKMSANTQDKTASFEAAESALKGGENWLMNLMSELIPVSTCSSHCIDVLDASLDVTAQSANWWEANSTQYTNVMHQVKTPPRYRIEFLRFVPDSPELGQSNSAGVYYYQITAYGSGNTDSAVTLLQTVAARRF